MDKNRLAILKKAIEFQKNKLKEEEKKYKIGKSSTHTILQYQDDLENAETRYLSIKLNYYMSILALEYEKGAFLKTFANKFYKKIINM